MPYYDPKIGGLRLSPGETTTNVYSPTIERQPQPGDVYEFVEGCRTIGGHEYPPGSHLVILEQTNEAPHGYINPQGNFKCRSPEGRVSVWSSIHGQIADGHLRLVREGPPPPTRFARI